MIMAAALLLILHGLDGHEITVNPRLITSLHAAIPDQDNKVLAKGVKCLVNTADGKFVSVVESCEEISRMIDKPQGHKP